MAADGNSLYRRGRRERREIKINLLVALIIFDQRHQRLSAAK